MKNKFRLSLCACAVLLGLTIPMHSAIAAPSDDPAALTREIGWATHYVEEFEKEVAREGGGSKTAWRSKNDALDRVKTLKQKYPDDPRVEELFQRTKVALMKSKGEYTQIQPEWTQYLRNEDDLRKTIAAEGAAKWQEFLTPSEEKKVIDKPFPTPDHNKVSPEELIGTYVVLDDVKYPYNQFYGATGEYIHVGKPSTGYYYVQIDNRSWLGPYEAVKRYRRQVDTSLQEVSSWTVYGKIVSIVTEVPAAGKKVVGNSQWGWVVEPVALYIPDHVLAYYEESAESSGVFVGESKVAQLKDKWYTVKDIPADVKPEALMDIFMHAIKEKNYELYQACIDPERQKTPVAEDLLRYHWDLHQERFHGEYIHAEFDEAKITVVQGFDDSNDDENFFLDDDQRAVLAKTQGDKIEKATVQSRAFDKNGKQLGHPHPHTLVRRNNGRWYVDDYAARF